jgi:DNA polymerase III delta prime subunit
MTAPASIFRNIKPISEILLPAELRGHIDHWTTTKNIPNLFFYGPPGTGKTSTILSICNTIYPREILTECVFLCNFSYNRGIKFIRDKVRQIAAWTIPTRDDTPRYKVIILDEIDCITSEAQAALSAIMSEFDTTVRFCLLCNNANKINPGLVMSCVQIGFYHNNPEIIIAIINQLQQKYSIKLDESDKKLLINYFQSDIRKMEQLLSIFPLLIN